ncbi:TPR domain-containing glycosyltransferase [Thermanaeromonas toyohensis]|nr:TPR domain-containing glycosyltransferase [Thermanaeromonas toyohensis]
MIVKDEAENLPRCLESARGAVDEVVVVDTGSSDGTPEVAAAFGARVLHVSWTDDFSAARNVSLDAARGDWVLWLDADEELVDPGAVRESVERAGEVSGFLLTVVNFIGTDTPGPDAVANPSLRLFRNRPEHRFSGAIHEQIAAAVAATGPLGWCPARINHYGYLLRSVLKKAKVERNLGILERMARENPRDSFTRFNLGVEYTRLCRWEDALREFQAAFPSLPAGLETAYAPVLLKNIVLCLRELGRYDEAMAVLRDAEAAYPDYTDLTYARGAVLLAAGCWSEAVRAFRECLRRGESGQRHITELGVGGYKALTGLGFALWRMGDRQGAAVSLAEALRQEPRCAEAACALANVLLDGGMAPRNVAATVAPLAKGAAVRALAGLFLERRCPEEALAVAGGDRVVRARSFWQKGDVAVALNELEGVGTPEAAWLRGVFLAAKGDSAGAVAEFERLRELLPEHAEAGLAFVGRGGKPSPVALGDLALLLAEGGWREGAVRAAELCSDPVAAGDVLRRAGLREEAAQRYTGAWLAGAELHAEALDFLVAVAKEHGMVEEAVLLAEAAWQKAPTPARCVRLATSLAAAGRPGDALEVLREGGRMFPYAETMELAYRAIEIARNISQVSEESGKRG